MDEKIVPLVDYSTGEKVVIGEARVNMDEYGNYTVDARLNDVGSNIIKLPPSHFSIDLQATKPLTEFVLRDIRPLPPFKRKE